MERIKVWTKDSTAIFCINFFVAMNFYLLMVVISDYSMNRFNASPSEAGFSASIFIIGALVARIFSGKWITQYGYKKTLYAGAIINLVMTLLYFAAQDLILLIGIRFFHGAAFGLTTTAADDCCPYCSSGKKERGSAILIKPDLATAIGPLSESSLTGTAISI